MEENEQAYVNNQTVMHKLIGTNILFLLTVLISTGCSSILAPISSNDPLTAGEHNNLGVIYEQEGKYDLALREYKMAASKDPELVTPLVNIGNVYLKQSEYEDAEKYYKKALKKDSMNMEAANNLASLYIETGGDYREGLKYLVAATNHIEPIPPYALDTLGVLYLKLGDIDKAALSLRDACNTSDGDPELKKEINRHMSKIGEGEICE